MKNAFFIFLGILLFFILFIFWYTPTKEPSPKQKHNIQRTQTSIPKKRPLTTTISKDTSRIISNKNTLETPLIKKSESLYHEDTNTITEDDNDIDNTIDKELEYKNIVKEVKPSKPVKTPVILLNAQPIQIKIKVVEKDGIVHVKTLIEHEMSCYHEKEVNYITRIVGIVKNKIVFDVSTSQNIAKDPIFKFKFKGHKGQRLHIVYVDLKGNTFTHHKKIK